MNIEEDIKKLENFKTIKILYGNTFVMHLEQLKNIQEAIDNILSDRERLKQENEKKDKIIDAMAIFMANLDIDEEICKHQVATFCDDKPEGVTLDVCAKCIKQYFERKVKDE